MGTPSASRCTSTPSPTSGRTGSSLTPRIMPGHTYVRCACDPVGDNRRVRPFRGAWSLAGLAAGVAGLATSYFVAMAMTIRESPVIAVAELVVRITPGWLAHYLIELVGQLDKPLLLLGIFV